MRSLLAALLLVASCGSDAGGLLVVTVDATGRVPAVASFRVVATNGSAPSSPIAIPVAHGPADIPPAQTFALAFDATRSGAVHVTVDALGSDGATIASGVGDGTITPGQETMATVLLAGAAVRDMGGDAAVDGAAGDMRGDAAVDGSVADLTQIVPPDLAPSCVTTLAGIGAGDFTIHFRVITKANVASTLLYQRAECDAAKDFWDVGMRATGGIVVEVGQGNVNYATLDTTIAVNDGNPHVVVVQRKATVLSSTIDGVFAGSASASETLGALPPLGVATGSPCEGHAGEVPLVGTVDSVCISIGSGLVADMGVAVPDLAAACGVCMPGQQITMACGNCGTETDTCTTSCQWSPGACSAQGACAPGATQGGGCDQCSQQTCGNNCQWSACALKPGNACEYKNGTNTRSCACGTLAPNCGVDGSGKVRTQGSQMCSESCQWNAWGNQCVCGCNACGSCPGQCAPSGAC